MTNTPRNSLVTLLTAALVAAAAGPVGAAPAAAPLPAPDRPELRQTMHDVLDVGLTGIQLRVNDDAGEWVASAGARKLGSSQAPPTDGVFMAGSVSKTVTATVVLQLVAEGRLGLDDRVADHLPGYGLDPRITVRMLLQHTSGVPSYTGNLTPDGALVPGIPILTGEWAEDYLDEEYEAGWLVRYALGMPALFEPGTRFSYSNTNYTLATLVVEEVTGRPFVTEAEERIFERLGMRRTSLPDASVPLAGPHAHGYFRYDDDGVDRVVDVSGQNLSWAPGAGDLVTSTADLHRFVSALASGDLVPAPLLAEMTTVHALPAYPDATQYLPYGLGIQVMDLGPLDPTCEGVTVLNHNGGAPGYAALMYSSLDGGTTLTASLTHVEDPTAPVGGALGPAMLPLLTEVFCG
ncbi:serine hydrolase domain-containing protein [Antribacter gilvus]|uniref:serine hydrolase domain-containing protein n=1 Tax=Antribacter gilvus TaxID=2304675 RepID=UPI000F769C46|nr:serine hydrolase domain-containing protein [Antribacter gilvus]